MMRNAHVITAIAAFIVVLVCATLMSCKGVPDVLGKWQETGTTATLEFRTDGAFYAVDDMEMAVSGTYTHQRDGRIRFEIINPGSSPEIVWGRINVRGDELIFTSDDNEEVEHYRRTR